MIVALKTFLLSTLSSKTLSSLLSLLSFHSLPSLLCSCRKLETKNSLYTKNSESWWCIEAMGEGVFIQEEMARRAPKWRGDRPTSVPFLAEIFNSPPCLSAKYEKEVCGWIWRWKRENGGGEWKWMK
jgi:hypothetical protein